MSQGRNQAIDIAKFVCALMVVYLHTINLGVPYNGSFISLLCNTIYRVIWAVNPVEFFFIVSSFLLFSREKINDIIVKKYLKRIGLLYTLWSFLYIRNFIDCFEDISLRGIGFSLLKCLRRFFFLGSGGHMWYVLSLFYGIIIIWILIKRNNFVLAWGISIVSYLISVFGDSYYNLLTYFSAAQKGLELVRSIFGSVYLFRGPMFIMIGFLIAELKKRHIHVRLRLVLILFLISALLNNIELLYIKKAGFGLQYSTTFLKPVTSLLFTLLVFNIPISVKANTIYLAQCSSVIYFSHIFFRDNIFSATGNYFFQFVGTLVICVLLYVVLQALYKKTKWPYIAYLF